METQTHESAQSAKGVVKWFNNAKGWGFISHEKDGSDIFVHYSQITGDGYRTLRQGEEVLFVLRDGPRGKWAEEVVGTGAETGAETSAETHA